MRRLVLAFGLLWALPALAATTWNPADKDPSITLSGGNLTATSAGTHKAVRGTVAKYNGKFCYEFTPNAALTAGFSIGIANGQYPLDYGATLGLHDFVNNFLSSLATGLAQSGNISWYTHSNSGADPPVNGQTGEVCVDLDSQPPYLWVTPDVAGTGGPSSGPKWNGDATANPVGDVAGYQIYMPRLQNYPAFSGNSTDSVTAAFTGFSPPTGYSTWDSAGGTPPIPGPLTPMTINVSNAPAWQASHSYALKDRVNAGAAWSGSAYTNGQPLCTFAVKVSAGSHLSGSSASAFNTACASGTPAATGGGLDGTIPAGWASATTVTDGDITWALLTRVDYVTFSSAMVDDPRVWLANTDYNLQEVVINGANSYYLTTAGNTNDPQCTSGSSGGPTGTTPATDGTCVWIYLATIPYTSGANQWPHYYNIAGQPSGQLYANFFYDVNIVNWYGGAQQTNYYAGHNNEMEPLAALLHSSTVFTEHWPVCYHAPPYYTSVASVLQYGWVQQVGCAGISRIYISTITAAPGDSFADNIIAASGPLRYDETKGVAFYNDATYDTGGGGWYPKGSGINILDDEIIERIQIKSVHGIGISSAPRPQLEWHHNIIESGDVAPTSLFFAGGGLIHDNLIINNSTDSACAAIFIKYHAAVYNNTAVGPNGTDCTFYLNDYGDGGATTAWTTGVLANVFYNNLVIGFPHIYAYGPGSGPFTNFGAISNNATDSATSTGTTFNMSANFVYGVTPYTPQDIGAVGSNCGAGNTGTCYSLTPSDVLVNPTLGASLDARIKTGSPVIGAGVGFSYNIGYWGSSLTPWSSPLVPAPTDLLGLARPQ